MNKNKMPVVTTDHNLSALVNKKIKGITLQELDIQGDGENIRQFYTITCSDGEKFVLAVDGNSAQQYATVELMEVDEFADFLEGIECEEPSDEELDLDVNDSEDENMFDNDDSLFDDVDSDEEDEGF